MPEVTNSSSSNSQKPSCQHGFFQRSNARSREMRLLLQEIGDDLNTIAHNLIDLVNTQEKSFKKSI